MIQYYSYMKAVSSKIYTHSSSHNLYHTVTHISLYPGLAEISKDGWIVKILWHFKQQFISKTNGMYKRNELYGSNTGDLLRLA